MLALFIDMFRWLISNYVIKLTEGSASERAEGLYSRSQSVCEWLGDKDREFPALWGMWSVVRSTRQKCKPNRFGTG